MRLKIVEESTDQDASKKSKEAISGDHALTHAIIIGIRKPLFTLQDHPDEAFERKTKKSVWE